MHRPLQRRRKPNNFANSERLYRRELTALEQTPLTEETGRKGESFVLGLGSYLNAVFYAGTVAMAFNPILLTPLLAFWLCFTIEVIGGLHV